MRKNIEEFIASIEVENTAKVVKHALKVADDTIIKYSDKELEMYIVGLEPRCPKSITTICYVLRMYGKWLDAKGVANKLVEQLDLMNQKALWEKIKPNVKSKFISHSTFLQTIEGIKSYEMYNTEYYSTLLKCIYEGVFNEDMSVIKNLRSSDITGNIVTMHADDGTSHDLKISYELAEELKSLARVNKWERPNRYGLCNVDMRGLYHDSVFKIEDRNTNSQGS